MRKTGIAQLPTFPTSPTQASSSAWLLGIESRPRLNLVQALRKGGPRESGFVAAVNDQLHRLGGFALLMGYSDDERKETAQTLLNTLQGQIENLNTRQAYKTAWGQFFKFCSENKLEQTRAKAGPTLSL